MTNQTDLGGSFKLPGVTISVKRMGYGAMQLTGPGVWGAPRDVDGAVSVLKEAIAAGVNHIDTSDYYGPHVTNQIIKRSPGHFKDWILACKGGEPACSDFSISGPYTEWMLLGGISWRFPNEKLQWDGANLRFTHTEKANEYVMPKVRKGWELKDIPV